MINFKTAASVMGTLLTMMGCAQPLQHAAPGVAFVWLHSALDRNSKATETSSLAAGCMRWLVSPPKIASAKGLPGSEET